MRLTIPTLFILTMFSQTGFGQKTAAQPAADNYSQANSRLLNSSSQTKQTISIDFPGGTIGDYIDLVKKDANSLNLIVTDGAKDLVLPKIALKNVPVDVAVNCIEQCFDPSETVVNVSSENRGIQIIQAQVTSRKEVDVINVKRLFDDKKLTEETFMQAIEIGLTMYSQKEKLKLKIQFHKETGLLFLSGLRREIQLVQQVVSQLQGNSFGPGGMGGASVGPGMMDGMRGGPGFGMDGGGSGMGMGPGGSGASGGMGEGGGYRPTSPRGPDSRPLKSNSNRKSPRSGRGGGGDGAFGDGDLGAGAAGASGGRASSGSARRGAMANGNDFGGTTSGGGGGTPGGGGSGGGTSGAGSPFGGR